MNNVDHIIVTIVVLVVLSAAAVASGYKPEVVAILSGALGWILGFWFGRSNAPT